MNWNTLLGKKTKADYYNPGTWEVIIQVGTVIDLATIDRLDVLDLVATEAELHRFSVEAPHEQTWAGNGRYKSANSKVLVRLGDGELRVNGQQVNEYFTNAPIKALNFLHRLITMDEVKQVLEQMEVIVLVEGCKEGSGRQARAVSHGLARAIAKYDSELGGRLKLRGFSGAKVKDKAVY